MGFYQFWGTSWELSPFCNASGMALCLLPTLIIEYGITICFKYSQPNQLFVLIQRLSALFYDFPLVYDTTLSYFFFQMILSLPHSILMPSITLI